MRRLASNERGVVAPIVAIMLVGLMAIAALVIDGGVAFSARRDLQKLADGASRAGAMQIDVATLRRSGLTRLDAVAAARAARAYLRSAGYTDTLRIRTSHYGVIVDLNQTRETVLISFLGIRTVRIRSYAVARPRVGIRRVGG